MTAPCFELDDGQRELQGWLHRFAADVIRPAAAEWDAREEFPWPVLEEAARIGLYSLDFFATQSLDQTGLGIPITMEELSGATPASGCRSSAPHWRPRASGPTAPTPRRASGCHRCSAPPATSGQPPSARPSPTPVPTSE